MTSRLLFAGVLSASIALPMSGAMAQPSGLPVDIPRDQLFVSDQILRYNVVGNYNFWALGPQNPTRQAMFMETLWIRDQETGELIYNAASGDPVYNDDFTEMSVELRDNIYWSDGVQFTADDLVYTIETLRDTPELGANGWHAQLARYVDSVEQTGDHSVTVTLTEPNSRFHSLFEARFAGVYMMPKHVFEEVDDLATFTNNPPVVLGNYLPVQADPNGFWELYERREDWERSPAGVLLDNPGPENILSIFYGDSTRKAIAMSRGELDVYFDADFDAFETTLGTTPTARSWYTEFPWAYPNEVDVRHLTFNQEDDPIYTEPDVRWALALALDMVELQTEYIGGVAKVTAIAMPPTPSLTPLYHDPLEEWLIELELDLGNGETLNPYDPTVPDQIAEWAEGQGYDVPGEPREVFGTGWWKFDPDAAEALLVKAGFSRDGSGNWLKPDGSRWTLDLQSPPDENDAFRIANGAADMWTDFGIDVNLQGLERAVWDQNHIVGQFSVSTPWHTFALASGDGWPEVRNWHPDYYAPVGEDARSRGSATNFQRINDPHLGELIDAMAEVEPMSEENHALMREYLQYWTEQMYFITTIGFKKFVTWDERYWTGFPTSESAEFMPLYWFQGGKYAFQSLRPVE